METGTKSTQKCYLQVIDHAKEYQARLFVDLGVMAAG